MDCLENNAKTPGGVLFPLREKPRYLLRGRGDMKKIIVNALYANRRAIMLDQAMRFVKMNDVIGDYLEFGVYGGEGFSLAFNLAKKKKQDTMRFFAFDSFEGLPKPEDKSMSKFSEGMYKCSLEQFKKNIERRNVDMDRVTITPGWFCDVLNDETKHKLGIKTASIVMIDCDLYESTVDVLNFITNYLVDGTILIFDDWFCYKGNPEKGEQKATKEWLEQNPEVKLIDYYNFGCHGKSFIVHIT